MEQSESINDLAAALVRANGSLKNPKFDSVNPAFKSGFASLAAIRDEVIPKYAAEGLTILQNPTLNEAGVLVQTTVLHSSGQWLRFGPTVIPLTKWDAWSVAGGTTYGKRIALQAIACIVGDADDDGAAAQQKGDRSGRPDTSGVDQEQATAYAKTFADALQEGDLNVIYENQDRLKGQPELYTAVWDKLSSKQRTDLRKIISERGK